MKRSLTPPVAFLTALALSACGGTDGSGAESEIESSVQAQMRAEDVDVDCPDAVQLRGGARLECRATVDGRQGVLLVTRRTDDGPLRWRLKPG